MQTEIILSKQALHFLPAPEADMPVFHWAHANGYSGKTYSSLLAPLQNQMHVYAWDARGHGQSTLEADPQAHDSWHIYCDDLIKVLERLVERHKKPIFLGGHSMGATISLMLAAQRPDLLAGLIFVDPVSFPAYFLIMDKVLLRLTGKSSKTAYVDAALKRRRVFDSAEEMFQRYHGRAVFKTWQDAFLTDYIKYASQPCAQGLMLSCDPKWEAANFAAQKNRSHKHLKKLKSPFVFLKGEKNSTAIHSRTFKRHPYCQHYEVIRASTHFLPMEHPEQVRAAILNRLMTG